MEDKCSNISGERSPLYACKSELQTNQIRIQQTKNSFVEIRLVQRKFEANISRMGMPLLYVLCFVLQQWTLKLLK